MTKDEYQEYDRIRRQRATDQTALQQAKSRVYQGVLNKIACRRVKIQVIPQVFMSLARLYVILLCLAHLRILAMANKLFVGTPLTSNLYLNLLNTGKSNALSIDILVSSVGHNSSKLFFTPLFELLIHWALGKDHPVFSL